jgi:hypothetical protein
MQSNHNNSSIKPLLFLLFLGLLCYLPFLGNTHLFDWDEINFAEISREMVTSNDYLHPQMNYQLFTEKPPMFFWMQSISMHFFGMNEMASRLPNALLGLIVLPVLFLIGKKLKDNLFGILWALAYGCTILPHLYFKSGIIDPWFNFFIFLSLYGLINAHDETIAPTKSIRWILFSGCMAAFSILTKGPAAIIIIGLSGAVYIVVNRFKKYFSIWKVMLFVAATFFITAIWFVVDFYQNGSQFIREFTIRQWELFTTKDAGHGGFFLYHFIVLFWGCFPISAFFIIGLIKKNPNFSPAFNVFKKWMNVLFWVVLILFSIVQTKIVHYSSLCYFPMSFIATICFYNYITKSWVVQKTTKWLILLSALPFAIAPFLLVYLGQHPSILLPLLSKDPFAVENMQAQVQWPIWAILPGIGIVMTVAFSLFYLNKSKATVAIGLLLMGSVFFIQGGLYFYINRIEKISQQANIEFWQQHAHEDAYKITYKYKSYSNFFYGKVTPQKNKSYTDESWLLSGKIDKPVYVSCRVNTKQEFETTVKDAVFLYNKNGFYFYKRNPLP